MCEYAPGIGDMEVSKNAVNKMMNMVMRANGLLKLLEELGELSQIASKAAIIHPKTKYYDGRDIKARLVEEMGDVLATLEYVVEKMHLSEVSIRKRAARKLKMYKMWEEQNKCKACNGTGWMEDGNQCRVCRATGVEQ